MNKGNGEKNKNKIKVNIKISPTSNHNSIIQSQKIKKEKKIYNNQRSKKIIQLYGNNHSSDNKKGSTILENNNISNERKQMDYNLHKFQTLSKNDTQKEEQNNIENQNNKYIKPMLKKGNNPQKKLRICINLPNSELFVPDKNKLTNANTKTEPVKTCVHSTYENKRDIYSKSFLHFFKNKNDYIRNNSLTKNNIKTPMNVRNTENFKYFISSQTLPQMRDEYIDEDKHFKKIQEYFNNYSNIVKEMKSPKKSFQRTKTLKSIKNIFTNFLSINSIKTLELNDEEKYNNKRKNINVTIKLDKKNNNIYTFMKVEKLILLIEKFIINYVTGLVKDFFDRLRFNQMLFNESKIFKKKCIRPKIPSIFTDERKISNLNTFIHTNSVNNGNAITFQEHFLKDNYQKTDGGNSRNENSNSFHSKNGICNMSPVVYSMKYNYIYSPKKASIVHGDESQISQVLTIGKEYITNKKKPKYAYAKKINNLEVRNKVKDDKKKKITNITYQKNSISNCCSLIDKPIKNIYNSPIRILGYDEQDKKSSLDYINTYMKKNQVALASTKRLKRTKTRGDLKLKDFYEIYFFFNKGEKNIFTSDNLLFIRFNNMNISIPKNRGYSRHKKRISKFYNLKQEEQNSFSFSKDIIKNNFIYTKGRTFIHKSKTKVDEIKNAIIYKNNYTNFNINFNTNENFNVDRIEKDISASSFNINNKQVNTSSNIIKNNNPKNKKKTVNFTNSKYAYSMMNKINLKKDILKNKNRTNRLSDAGKSDLSSDKKKRFLDINYGTAEDQKINESKNLNKILMNCFKFLEKIILKLIRKKIMKEIKGYQCQTKNKKKMIISKNNKDLLNEKNENEFNEAIFSLKLSRKERTIIQKENTTKIVKSLASRNMNKNREKKYSALNSK